MCAPPFCEPARHVFGCMTLRQGASGVLIINIIYGLALIIIHALISSEVAADDTSEGSKGTLDRGYDSWMLEMQDLNFAWAHRLLGLGEHFCLWLGLLYGVLVVVVSLVVLHQVCHHGTQVASLSQYFVAVLHVELILYVGISLAKLPRLCTMQEQYWAHLHMDCGVLKFMFLEKMVLCLAGGSLCTWIFASFAFFVQGSQPTRDAGPVYSVGAQSLVGPPVHGPSFHSAVPAGSHHGHYTFPRQGTSLVSHASAPPLRAY